MITLFLTMDDMQRIKHIISIYLFFTGFFPFLLIYIYLLYICIYIYSSFIRYSVYTLYIKYICGVRSYALTRINNHLYDSFIRRNDTRFTYMAGSSKFVETTGRRKIECVTWRFYRIFSDGPSYLFLFI